MGIWGIRMGLGNWRRLGYVVQGDVAITEHRGLLVHSYMVVQAYFSN